MLFIIAFLLAVCLAALPTTSAQGVYVWQSTTLPPIDSFEIQVGATASFHGPLSKGAIEAYQGLRLTEEVINSRGIFKTRGGNNITVNLTVFDDWSSPAYSGRLYQRMVDSKDYDFFIGPYSSYLSQEAARVTENADSEQLLMLHAAPNPAVFANQFKHVFAVNALASQYFAKGLEQLRELVGARTVTLVRGAGGFHRSTCDGARDSALSLNYEIRGYFVTFGTEVTEAIRASKDAHADVFLVCSDLKAEITIAMTAKALMFSPRAMLMKHAASQTFIDTVGAKNANYILGMRLWDRELNLPCRVYETSESFFELFVERWGTYPTENSAKAASALITLLLVTELYAKSKDAVSSRPPVPNEIVWRLREEEFHTFAGTFRFHQDGPRLSGQFSWMKQIVPDSLAQSPLERYTQSEVVMVTEAHPPRYPALSWEQRELEVYPCPRGSVISMQMSCELCPVGTARNSASLSCRACQGNSYSDQPGLGECIPCKRGISCSGDQGFVAARGFYRVRVSDVPEPDAASTFPANIYSPSTMTSSNRPTRRGRAEPYKYYECDPPKLCLGANQCLGDNIGILCAQCPTGYTNRRLQWGGTRNLCKSCPSSFGNLFWFVAAFVVYIASITVVSVSDRASSKSLTAVHGVILKIVINYLQFMSTVLAAADFKAINSLPALKSLLELVCSPLKVLLILDCFSKQLNVHPENTTVIMGWLLIPLGLGCSWLFFALLTCIHVICHRRRLVEQEGVQGSRLSTASIDGEYGDDDDDDVFGDVEAAVETGEGFAEEALGEIEDAATKVESGLVRAATMIQSEMFGEAEERQERQTKAAKTKQGEATESYSVVQLQSGSVEVKARLRSQKSATDLWSKFAKAAKPHENHSMDLHLMHLWTRTAIISIFLLYPVALEMLVSGMSCTRVGQLRLVSNLDVTCNSDDHVGWFYASFMGAVVYGLGIPALTFWKLFNTRDQLRDMEVRRNYGFLYNGFEPHYYYFEVLYMIRKFLIIFASAIPDLYARVMIMLWMGLAFMAIQLVCRPWDNRAFFVFDKLETFNLLALLLSVALRLWLEIRNDLDSVSYTETLQSEGFDIIAWLIVCMAHVAFWIVAISGLLRNTVIRHWQFRKRVLPNTLSPFQAFLCRAYQSTDNIIKMRTKAHLLDFEDISHEEIIFFHTALCDTLEQYLFASKYKNKFCLEYMWGAIQETFTHYEMIHKLKIDRLVQSDVDHGFVDRLQRGDVSYAPKTLTAQDGLTLEEFQVALMASWPGIVSGEDKYFQPFTQYDQAERLNYEALSHNLVWEEDVPLTHMLDILQRRDELLSSNKDKPAKDAALQDALKPLTGGDMHRHFRLSGLVGMEDARKDVMSSTLDVKDDDFNSVEAMLREYEATFEELLMLRREAQALRHNCAHRVRAYPATTCQQESGVSSDEPISACSDARSMDSQFPQLDFSESAMPAHNSERGGQAVGPAGKSPPSALIDSTVQRSAPPLDDNGREEQNIDTAGCQPASEVQALVDPARGDAQSRRGSNAKGQPSHPLQLAFQSSKAHILSSAFVDRASGSTDI